MRILVLRKGGLYDIYNYILVISNMKIVIHDNAAFKFSQMIAEHWKKRGHEVVQEMGANPALGETADLIYIDFLDSNFYCYFNGPKGDRNPSYPKKRIAVRAIDIDIWMGRHRDPIIWKYMDDMIVINKFYYDMIQKEGSPPPGKLHLIRPGVDLNKFTLKPNLERGFKVAMVTGNIWEAKAVYEGIRVFQEVVRLSPHSPWELHIRGQHINPEWHRVAYDQLIKTTGLADKITIHPKVHDIAEWYRDKDFILVTSHKEAFSYAAAEGMAVGLKPVINTFFGSEDIWAEKYRFTSLHQAAKMITEGEYNPEGYRRYIKTYYPFERMMQEYDKLFGT